jgi:rod shape-determining protein MreC
MRDYIDDVHLKIRGRGEQTSSGTLRRSLLLALLLCALAGGLIWLDYRGTLTPVHGVAGRVLSPLAGVLSGVNHGASDIWNSVTELGTLRAENAALRQQQSELQAEVIALERARVENLRLRQQLEIQKQQPWHLLGAEVTMRSPDAGQRMITIARGSADDVAPGMAVVGQTNSGPVALVGIVSDVGAQTARVLLITDFSCRVSARLLEGGDTALGLVQGQWQRGSRLRLEHVERESLLREGAIVVTAGLTGEMAFPLPLSAVPADVPIGEVEQISSEGTAQVAELRPYADPDQVRYVWVILDQES